MMFRRGELRSAIPFFEKAAAVAAKDHDSASMLISCYAFAGDAARMRHSAEMAVRRAEKIIIGNPKNAAAFASTARGLAALGEVDRAKRWIRKALNIDPGNLSMRYSVASTMASLLNDLDGALEILEPFAELAANRPHLQLLESDPALASLRDQPQFRQMADRANKRAGAFQPAPLSSR
jgi:adenylate cyclase